MHLLWHLQDTWSLLWVLWSQLTSLALAGCLFTCSDGSWRYTVFSMLEPPCSGFRPLTLTHLGHCFDILWLVRWFWSRAHGPQVISAVLVSHRWLFAQLSCVCHWTEVNCVRAKIMYFMLPKKSLFCIEKKLWWFSCILSWFYIFYWYFLSF